MSYSKFPNGKPSAYSAYSGIRTPAAMDPSSLGPAPTQDQFQRQPNDPYGALYGQTQTDWNAYRTALDAYNEKKAALMQGRNADGSPIAPEFQTLIDPKTGRLKDGLQLDVNNVEGFGQYKDFATGTGPSAWAQASQDQLGLMTSIERDRATREAGQAAATARGNLAMRGGLSSGARERLGSQSMTNAMEGRQMARQNQLMGLSDILTKDAAAKQTALGNMVDLGARAEEYNLGAALDEINAEREAAYRQYEEEGKRWAADKKAEAQRAASGGGCFAAGTLIRMEDGTEKRVEDIEIGDHTYVGGKVYAVYKAAWTQPVFNYNGILVTGEHPVYENGIWKRVYESDVALVSKIQPNMVYDFSNDKHRIVIGDVTFTDFAEMDDFSLSYEESIERLNG